jgi:hypothetical protein
MNEQFRNPAFENVSFDMNESESFEFPSPITPSDQDNANDKAVVSEAIIAPEEHQVVSCADISQLENLFGMLNVETSMTDGAETDGMFENLIEEPDLGEKVSENTQTQEGSVLSERYISESLNQEGELEIGETISNSENPSQEYGLESPEILSSSEKIQEKQEQDIQENFKKHDPTANQVLRNLDARETVSEIPVTSSVNVQEMLMEPITIASVLFTEHVVPETTPGQDLFDPTTKMLKDYDSDHLSMSKDFTNDHPITSTPEYRPNHHSETNVISTSTPNQEENGGTLDNDDLHRPDYDPNRGDHGLRRSYSEDLTDETLTDGSLNKSSSEITVSPREDEDHKTRLSSRSLGNLLSAPPRGRVQYIALFFLETWY